MPCPVGLPGPGRGGGEDAGGGGLALSPLTMTELLEVEPGIEFEL